MTAINIRLTDKAKTYIKNCSHTDVPDYIKSKVQIDGQAYLACGACVNGAKILSSTRKGII